MKNELPTALPLQYRAQPIGEGAIDVEKRTVTVTFTTGAAVRRRRWVGWETSVPFEETLEVSAKAVNLDRLNAGAPALESHSTWSTYSQVGVVEKAWIEGKEGRALIRFPAAGIDEKADRLFALVTDRIVRNVSVGYSIDQARVIEAEKKGDIEKRIIERWTPYEISFVTIPADAGAQVRSQDPGAERAPATYPLIFNRAQPTTEESAMTATTTQTGAGAPPADETRAAPAAGADPAASAAAQADATRGQPAPTAAAAPAAAAPAPALDEAAVRAAAQAAVAADRQRSADITGLAKRFGQDAFGDEHVRAGTTVEAFRSKLIDKLAEAGEQLRVFPHVDTRGGQDEQQTRREAVENALLHRYDPRGHTLSDAAREWRGMSLIEIARETMRRAGERVGGLSKDELARRALHGTSDFVAITEAVTGKSLRKAYEAYPNTFRPWTRQTSAPDFKDMHRVQLGEAPQLLKVGESGEIKRGTIGEGKEKYRIGTYARIVGLTRQVIINDDLDAFTRLPAIYGTAAATLEGDVVWGIVTSNPQMADGNALFHTAKHGNLAGAGTALSAPAIGVRRAAMAKQTGVDGRTKLNLRPAFVLVPSELEFTAEQIMSSTIVAAEAGKTIPESIKKLQPISEPRLSDASATAWYLVASPAQIDTIEFAYLEGQEGVYIESRMGFDVDGVEFKARLDFGAAAIDWRGFQKDPGAAP